MNGTKNVLLQRAPTGRAKVTCRDLPLGDHVYGKELPKNEIGVKESKANKVFNFRF
jgi:hypothetical protein